jgi:hypothetical protein
VLQAGRAEHHRFNLSDRDTIDVMVRAILDA